MPSLIGISSGFTDYGDYLGIAFSRPLEARGAVAVILPFSVRPLALLEHIDGLLLGVGQDLEPRCYKGAPHVTSTLHSPLRDEMELALVPAAVAAGIPVLGICRGMQVINVAFGGTLHADHSVLEDLPAAHPGGDWERWQRVVAARVDGLPAPPHPRHSIAIEPGSLLAQALGTEAVVNSYHHQSLATLGARVQVSARAPDGVIEAIEVPSAEAMCLGVQWELQEQPDGTVFALLVEAARARAVDKHRRGVRLGSKLHDQTTLALGSSAGP
jgi:putative glutamine amidotransferase